MPRHAIFALVFSLVITASTISARPTAPLPSIDQARSFRLKMIVDYAPATWDDLVLARQCLRCGALVGRQTILPGQARPRTPADWLARVQEVAARTVLHRRCPRCDATPAGIGFRTVLFSGMVFLEGGGDLQLTVDDVPGKNPAVQLTLAKLDGNVQAIPWPVTAAAFASLTGAPLSVRESWRDLIETHARDAHPVFTRAQDGYFLVFAPAAVTDADRATMQKEVVALLENLTKQAGGPLHLEALRDLEEQKRPIRRDTYHDWLAPYASAIQAGDVTAIAAVHPPTFMKILAREAEALGVTVQLPLGRETEVVLTKGTLHMKVPCSGPLIRAIHTGQSFEQGVIPLLAEVNHVRAMARLQRRVSELVAGRYQSEIVDGQRMRFHALKGQPAPHAPEIDLAALAGKIDLSDERKSGGDRLARLIGLDPATGRFLTTAPTIEICSCGRPTTPGLKVRPASLANAANLLVQKEGDVLIAAVVECPDHIRYLKPGQPHKDFAAARKAFEQVAANIVFPITGVGLIPYKGESLPYALGQDLPTAALDPGLAAGLVETLEAHFKGRTAAPPLVHLPGPNKQVSIWAPFEHAVIVSAAPIAPADRPEVARLLKDALENPFGHVDPGPSLDFARVVTLGSPRGRFERKAQ